MKDFCQFDIRHGFVGLFRDVSSDLLLGKVRGVSAEPLKQRIDARTAISNQIDELNYGKWHGLTVNQLTLQVVSKMFKDAVGGKGF